MTVSAVHLTLRKLVPKTTRQKDSGRCFPPAFQRKIINKTYGSYGSYDLLQLFYFNITITGTVGAIALDVTIASEIENFLHMLGQFIFKFALGNEMPPDILGNLNVKGVNLFGG